jgi:hypothetical protein
MRKFDEAGEMFPLQEDRTLSERLSKVWAGGIKVDPAKFAYATIRALTKEQKEEFTKMVMEGGDQDF